MTDEKAAFAVSLATRETEAVTLTRRPMRALDPQPKSPMNLCCPSFLSCLGSILCPICWLGGSSTVREKEEVVVLNFGKYVTTVREPGCFCLNPIGTTLYPVSTASVALNLTEIKVADARVTLSCWRASSPIRSATLVLLSSTSKMFTITFEAKVSPLSRRLLPCTLTSP